MLKNTENVLKNAVLDSSRRVFIQTCRRNAPGTKTNFAEMAVLRAATAVQAAQA